MKSLFSTVFLTLATAYISFDGNCEYSGGSMTYQNGEVQYGVGGLNSAVDDLRHDCSTCLGGSSFSESTSKAWSENGKCTVESADINCHSDGLCVVSADSKTCNNGICDSLATTEATVSTTKAPVTNVWCRFFGWFC